MLCAGYDTYITGNTLGKTTEASAKYWYNIRVSPSSVAYLTKVARTVSTNAWVEKSVKTSGSRSILFSFETDTRALRFCEQQIIFTIRLKLTLYST